MAKSRVDFKAGESQAVGPGKLIPLVHPTLSGDQVGVRAFIRTGAIMNLLGGLWLAANGPRRPNQNCRLSLNAAKGKKQRTDTTSTFGFSFNNLILSTLFCQHQTTKVKSTTVSKDRDFNQQQWPARRLERMPTPFVTPPASTLELRLKNLSGLTDFLLVI
jgi:hypothetical protein